MPGLANRYDMMFASVIKEDGRDLLRALSKGTWKQEDEVRSVA